MVADHQSGWTYLLILGGLAVICLLVRALGKLFPHEVHTAAGNALLRAEAIFLPSRENVIEAKKQEQDDDANGDPAESGEKPKGADPSS